MHVRIIRQEDLPKAVAWFRDHADNEPTSGFARNFHTKEILRNLMHTKVFWVAIHEDEIVGVMWSTPTYEFVVTERWLNWFPDETLGATRTAWCATLLAVTHRATTIPGTLKQQQLRIADELVVQCMKDIAEAHWERDYIWVKGPSACLGATYCRDFLWMPGTMTLGKACFFAIRSENLCDGPHSRDVF